MTTSLWPYLLLGAGLPAVIGTIVLVLGFGPAVATLLANSRIARGAGVVAAVVWFFLMAAARIRSTARHEAMAEVQRGNAAAREDRQRIERDVRAIPEDEVTEELSTWSR